MLIDLTCKDHFRKKLRVEARLILTNDSESSGNLIEIVFCAHLNTFREFPTVKGFTLASRQLLDNVFRTVVVRSVGITYNFPSLHVEDLSIRWAFLALLHFVTHEALNRSSAIQTLGRLRTQRVLLLLEDFLMQPEKKPRNNHQQHQQKEPLNEVHD